MLPNILSKLIVYMHKASAVYRHLRGLPASLQDPQSLRRSAIRFGDATAYEQKDSDASTGIRHSLLESRRGVTVNVTDCQGLPGSTCSIAKRSFNETEERSDPENEATCSKAYVRLQSRSRSTGTRFRPSRHDPRSAYGSHGCPRRSQRTPGLPCDASRGTSL